MKKNIILSFVIAVLLTGAAFIFLMESPQKPASDIAVPESIVTSAVTPTPIPAPILTPQPTPSIVTLSFAGDVIFDSWVGSLIDQKGPAHVISDLKGIFHKSEISMVNLETPISLRGTKENDKQFTFRAKPEHINVLTEAGINMVTLANNHILDFGLDALRDTIDLLKDHNIGFVGAGEDVDEASRPRYVTKNDCTVAFVASSHVIPFVTWTAGVNKPGVASTYDPTRLLAEIEKARKAADIVVVYVHWGEEMVTMPVPYQKNLARMYIDKGADVVIGSHPHILQGLEFYKGKIISYSLGNFIFTNQKKDTAILNIEIRDKAISKIKMIPCEINNFRTALVEDPQKTQNILNTVKALSFGADILPDGTVVPSSAE